MVSFQLVYFTRVFGIPGKAQGRARINIKAHKMSKEMKLQLIRLVCKDDVQQHIDTLMATSTKRGLQKSEICEGHWK